ncbi:unnamed protein product, partial [marine sediment metagenome]
AKWFLGLESRILFGAGTSLPRESAAHPQGASDLASRLLDPVERNFIPTLEVWQSDKTGTVTGRILDQNNDPVINARVEIHSVVVTTYTDSNGYFSATVVPGIHTVYVWNSDGDQIIVGEPITATEGGTAVIPDQVVDDPSANHAPVISSLTANPSSIVGPPPISKITLEVSDSDGDNINWSATIISGPSEGNISPESGTIEGGSGSTEITFHPPFENGTYTVTFSINDGKGGLDTGSVNITVD